MSNVDQKLLRIGVFYDGNFFYHVSNYYRYAHKRKKRISIPGLHEFIRHHVANAEGSDVRLSHIVDAHFFRGRIWAKEADNRQLLYAERVFDDILMAEGVVTHYLPIPHKAEKGIDVWLALESFELALYKKFNVLVLIAGDADFIPLVRKVNSLGTRVMILGWDFKYTDDYGRERETVTSLRLLEEASYPVMMHQIIDDKTRRDDLLVNNIFFDYKDAAVAASIIEEHALKEAPAVERSKTDSINRYEGIIINLSNGYGFIKCTDFPNNVFFHWVSINNMDFAELQKGQNVSFLVQQGEKGPIARDIYIKE